METALGVWAVLRLTAWEGEKLSPSWAQGSAGTPPVSVNAHAGWSAIPSGQLVLEAQVSGPKTPTGPAWWFRQEARAQHTS